MFGLLQSCKRAGSGLPPLACPPVALSEEEGCSVAAKTCCRYAPNRQGVQKFPTNTPEHFPRVCTPPLPYGCVSALFARLPFPFTCLVYFSNSKSDATTKSSFSFAVALHRDISITIWSLVAAFVWHQLYPEWVYPVDQGDLARNAYTYGGNLIEVSCKHNDPRGKSALLHTYVGHKPTKPIPQVFSSLGVLLPLRTNTLSHAFYSLLSAL